MPRGWPQKDKKKKKIKNKRGIKTTVIKLPKKKKKWLSSGKRRGLGGFCTTEQTWKEWDLLRRQILARPDNHKKKEEGRREGKKATHNDSRSEGSEGSEGPITEALQAWAG